MGENRRDQCLDVVRDDIVAVIEKSGRARGPAELLELSEWAFDGLEREDWLEAFAGHPKIGDLDALRRKLGVAAERADAELAGSEQIGTARAADDVLRALHRGNRRYEQRFGYIFIVCATGKSADEMLGLLEARLENDSERELEIAAGEQRKITHLRLEKLAP